MSTHAEDRLNMANKGLQELSLKIALAREAKLEDLFNKYIDAIALHSEKHEEYYHVFKDAYEMGGKDERSIWEKLFRRQRWIYQSHKKRQID